MMAPPCDLGRLRAPDAFVVIKRSDARFSMEAIQADLSLSHLFARLGAGWRKNFRSCRRPNATPQSRAGASKADRRVCATRAKCRSLLLYLAPDVRNCLLLRFVQVLTADGWLPLSRARRLVGPAVSRFAARGNTTFLYARGHHV